MASIPIKRIPIERINVIFLLSGPTLSEQAVEKKLLQELPYLVTGAK